jgi:hypothetical protein
VKPQYEQYRANRKGSELKGFRLPTELYSHIERLAEIEGDSVTGLVIEGLARVLEDRLNPDHLASSAAAFREQAELQIAAMQELAEQVKLRGE